MSLPDVRELIASFDKHRNKALPLDLARRMAEDVSDLAMPDVNELLAYCQLIGSLCDMYLTGPSIMIAQTLEGAARTAANVGNHKLALFGNWYGACCRLARVVVRGDRSNSELLRIAELLSHITAMAEIQEMKRLRAVSAATRVECLARLRERPNNFDAELRAALTLLSRVDQADARVAERTQLLLRIRNEDFNPGQGGYKQLPSIIETYLTLMNKPGDLMTTVRPA
jgi:hypothetical protein